MIYLERKPAPPLDRFVRVLWYAHAPNIAHRHERILPTGCVQIILNLANDYLHDCPEGQCAGRVPPALVIGGRSVYEIVDTTDMADLIGMVFAPAGFGTFARDAVDLFSNRSVSLEDVWGTPARSLRDRLRELPGPQARLRCLEEFLFQRFAPLLTRQNAMRHSATEYALGRFEGAPGLATVRDVARSTGWSERRFTQVFREEVGFSPKIWCRIRRFQRAVQLLHAGTDVPWSRLALDCGFYDQSHFANEFKSFSGIDATTYSGLRGTPWANHVPVE